MCWWIERALFKKKLNRLGHSFLSSHTLDVSTEDGKRVIVWNIVSIRIISLTNKDENNWLNKSECILTISHRKNQNKILKTYLNKSLTFLCKTKHIWFIWFLLWSCFFLNEKHCLTSFNIIANLLLARCEINSIFFLTKKLLSLTNKLDMDLSASQFFRN